MSVTSSPNASLRCPVCKSSLSVRLARGRKSGKPFVMLLCSMDGRHLRAFINDHAYVEEVLSHLEGQTSDPITSQVI